MNAVAMKVVSAEKHLNADALFLYKLKSADKEVEIIANLDRNYQVGDIVAIALVGSVLKAALQRLRPILMTTINTVVGMFPLELELG